MRDVIFTLMIAGLLPACFRRPLIGLLTFSWLAYMRTQDLTWGFARHQRWSFLIAGVTTAGFIANPAGRTWTRDVRTYCMIFLMVWIGLSVVFGEIQDDYQFKRYVEYVKIVVISMFTTVVVVKREHLRVLVWVIALSFGFYGIKIGLGGVLSGGSMQVLQGPGGNMADNNDFSLALCMALPLLLQIGLTETNKHLRRGILLALPLTALTVIMTRSRGGFLSLMAVIGIQVWNSKNRMAGFAAGFVLMLGGLLFIPSEYVERLQTLRNPTQDGSAMGRLAAWETAWNMAVGNPVFGVGMTQFEKFYDRYRGPMSQGLHGRVAHNAYFQILAECGFPALIVYVFLLMYSIYCMGRLKRDAKRQYTSSWIINYATMFETTLIAFMIGSTFLNRAHFDLFYHFVAITVAFEVIARREMKGLVVAPRRGGKRSRGTLVATHPGGFQRAPLPSGFRDRPRVG